MRDPFPVPPLPWLSNLVTPVAARFSLVTLPQHIHEIVLSFLFYSLIFYPISPLLSRALFPAQFSKLSRKTRLSWNAHVVSLVQSVLLNVLALRTMIYDASRSDIDLTSRLWGYTGAWGMIQALVVGYFLWDTIISALHLDIFGPGSLIHGVCALLVYSIGFRPLLNYYGCHFILFELSTPFLNIHWFLDKCGKTGSRLQLYNGVILIVMFFACRIVWGPYMSLTYWVDIWHGLGLHPQPSVSSQGVAIMPVPTDPLPILLARCLVIPNIILNALNFYWFGKMIKALKKRF